MTGDILSAVPGNVAWERAQPGSPMRSASTATDVINRALAGLFGEPAPW